MNDDLWISLGAKRVAAANGYTGIIYFGEVGESEQSLVRELSNHFDIPEDEITIMEFPESEAEQQKRSSTMDMHGYMLLSWSDIRGWADGRIASRRTAAIDDDYNAEMRSTLTSWPKASKSIDTFRDIVNSSSSKMIDGVFVDMQTANAIVTVYDALNDVNKAKLMALSVDRLADAAWKLISKSASLHTAEDDGLKETCANCGTKVGKQSRECKKCGYLFPSVPKFATMQSEAAESDIRFKCYDCGARFKGMKRKCSKCGSYDIDIDDGKSS